MLLKVSRFLVQSLGKTLVLCFTYAFNVYDIYGMVWYTQVELVIVISVLTRKFRDLNNEIDLAIFQEGEEGELKSENILKNKKQSSVERGPGAVGLGLL